MMAQSELFEVIHVRDPAIDWPAVMKSGLAQKWIETRDAGLLEPFVIRGQRPTRYRLREIPNRLMARWVTQANSALDGGATAETYMRAFACSLVGVENMPMDDGVVHASWAPPVQKESGLFEGVLEDKAMDLFLVPELIDVGALAYQRSGFRRGTRPTFRLPPMFLDLLGHPLRPSAEPSPSSQAQPSETQSHESAA